MPVVHKFPLYTTNLGSRKDLKHPLTLALDLLRPSLVVHGYQPDVPDP
jgi:hypothetical protein